MSFFRKKPSSLIYFILLAVVLRFSLIFLDFSFDINSYIAWAKEAIKYGLPGFYERPSLERYSSVFPNYPPLSIFLFIIFHSLHQFVFKIAWQINLWLPLFPSKLILFLESRQALAGFMKLPGVAFDIGLALLIYQFIKKLKVRTGFISALVGANLILFNPGFFYNSSYLGQIESIPLFFLIASFYVLFFCRSIFWSLPLFTLAILSKQTAVIFFPVIIFIFVKKGPWRSLIKGTFLSLAIFLLSFVFFYQRGSPLLFPFKTYLEKILLAPGLPFASNHAYNFWALITSWQNIKDTTKFLFFNYQTWGYLIGGLLLLIGYLSSIALEKEDWLFNKKLSAGNILKVAAFLALTVFLFFTKIHERHLQQALPFLLLAGLKDKKFLRGFYYFSFVYFINIYHNWPVPKIVLFEYLVKLPLVVNGFIIFSLIIYFYLLFAKITSCKSLPIFRSIRNTHGLSPQKWTWRKSPAGLRKKELH